MARYFADNGWNDIFIAFPVNILEMEQINKLAGSIKLYLAVESEEAVELLSKNLEYNAGVYIKIDTGYHRTGIPADDVSGVEKVLQKIEKVPNLDITGFFTHAGHAYDVASVNEILKIHNDSLGKLVNLKNRFSKKYPGIIVSIGDTPSSSLATDFTGADELRPGNFIFYDVMQYFLGACKPGDIAVATACPVVAKHKERNEIVIYGGAVHHSLDSVTDTKGRKVFGLVVKMTENGWGKPLNDTFVSSLSQEHGIIKAPDEVFNSIEVGDIVGILPIHSCLTANLAKEYFTFDEYLIKKL
jgi:D-serine deaminase-like pyridoxal phosphate-dependent protein